MGAAGDSLGRPGQRQLAGQVGGLTQVGELGHCWQLGVGNWELGGGSWELGGGGMSVGNSL